MVFSSVIKVLLFANTTALMQLARPIFFIESLRESQRMNCASKRAHVNQYTLSSVNFLFIDVFTANTVPLKRGITCKKTRKVTKEDVLIIPGSYIIYSRYVPITCHVLKYIFFVFRHLSLFFKFQIEIGL